MTKYMRDIILSAVFSGGSGGYPEPTGVLAIEYTQNGEYIEDIKDYATVKTTVNVSGGGGGGDDVLGYVTFYDYNGDIIDKWTKEEAAAATELPEPPAHNGLTFQEWNWTLDEIKGQIDTGFVDVGSTFMPSDEHTHIFINLTDKERLQQAVNIYPYDAAADVLIDWGDGSPLEAIGFVDKYHTYEDIGRYEIKIISQNNALYEIKSVFGAYVASYNANLLYARSCVEAVWLGNYCRCIQNSGMRYCINMMSVVIPHHTTEVLTDNYFNSYFVQYSHVSCIVIPRHMTGYDSYLFDNTRFLKHISMPRNESTGTEKYYMVSNCPMLQRIYINGWLSDGANLLQGDTALTAISFDKDVDHIGSTFAYDFRNLNYIKLPHNMNSIGTGLRQLTSLTLDLTNCTQIPAVNSNAFTNANNFLLVFADNMAEDAKVATNWSSWSARILSKTEYIARFGKLGGM